VQADAGKAGGILESLLVEHARLNKKWGKLARLLSYRNSLSPAVEMQKRPDEINRPAF
jgi:hypothetical protein